MYKLFKVIIIAIFYINSAVAERELDAKYVKTNIFTIYTAGKFSNTQRALVVYIEGDGNAWINRTTLSNNPTPINPVAYKLATLDKSDNVLYIARPCQFLSEESLNSCSPKYWSKARYSKEVVESINEVISYYLREYYVDNGIHLVGYSGGGTIATLMPLFRNDILSIRTIAANLDHKRLGARTNTTPLVESLNPFDKISSYPKISQHHYIGMRDNLINSNTALEFSLLQPHKECSRVSIIEKQGHNQDWERLWPELQKNIPKYCYS